MYRHGFGRVCVRSRPCIGYGHCLRGGAVVKKIPIIGLLIGAVIALFAMKKKKGEAPTEDSDSASSGE